MTGPARVAGRGSTVSGVAALAAASAVIGTQGPAAALWADPLSGFAVGAWRLGLGAAVLVALCALRGQAPWRYRPRMRWVSLGALGAAGSQALLFEAMARTGVAAGMLVSMAAFVGTGGLLDWLAWGRRPNRRWLAGAALALLGVALLSDGDAAVDWSGAALAALSGSAGTGWWLAVQRMMTDRPALTSVATVAGAGAVVLAPVAAWSWDAAFDSVESTATVLWLGLATYALGHSVWTAGLKRVGLSVAVVVSTLEPATASVLAVTVLAEPATMGLVAGVCLVMAGASVASLSKAPRPAAGGPRPAWPPDRRAAARPDQRPQPLAVRGTRQVTVLQSDLTRAVAAAAAAVPLCAAMFFCLDLLSASASSWLVMFAVWHAVYGLTLAGYLQATGSLPTTGGLAVLGLLRDVKPAHVGVVFVCVWHWAFFVPATPLHGCPARTSHPRAIVGAAIRGFRDGYDADECEDPGSHRAQLRRPRRIGRSGTRIRGAHTDRSDHAGTGGRH